MKNCISVLALAAIFLADPAAAAEPSPPPAGARFGEMSCVDPKDVLDLSFEDADMRVNNISIRETVALVSKAPLLTLTASVVNKNARRASVSLEVASGVGSGLGFVLNARPILGYMQGNASDQIDTWIVLPAGEAAKAEYVCVRASKFFAPS